MTGLDLETFLQLLRADVGAWASLALVVVVLALMTWTSWGSRRALRKCLVLSIAAHVGLLLYGSTLPLVAALLKERPGAFDEPPPVRVQLAPTAGGTLADAAEVKGRDGTSSKTVAFWDRAGDAATLADPTIRPAMPAEPKTAVEPTRPESAPVAPESVTLDVNPPAPTPMVGTTPGEQPARGLDATPRPPAIPRTCPRPSPRSRPGGDGDPTEAAIGGRAGGCTRWIGRVEKALPR